MSFESWKKEFYPKDASDVKDKDALDHSIKKWEGVTSESLKKHRLRRNDAYIFENDHTTPVFHLNSDSCALCMRFYDYVSNCKKCPIVKGGGKNCNNDKSAYAKVIYQNSPVSVMIKALKKAKKIL